MDIIMADLYLYDLETSNYIDVITKGKKNINKNINKKINITKNNKDINRQKLKDVMEFPYVIVCDKTKTYSTNLTKITSDICGIKYIIGNVTHSIIDIIHDYTHSDKCEGKTIYLETLDLTDISMYEIHGFKLTKLILPHIDTIYDMSIDVLDISKSRVEEISNTKIGTLIPCENIGSLNKLTIDTLDLSNVKSVGSIHHIIMKKFIPSKNIECLYSIIVPTLDLSTSENVYRIHNIKIDNFIGCKNIKHIYDVACVNTVDLSAIEDIHEIYDIQGDKIILPKRIVHRVYNITANVLDFSQTDFVKDFYDVYAKKAITGKKIGTIYDSTIHEFDASLCNSIDEMCNVTLGKSFSLPKCVKSMYTIKRGEK